MYDKLTTRLDFQDKTLARIETQTTITNGKVSDISRWRERVMGATWALSVITVLVVIPLLTWAFITISHIPDNINKGISDALANYDINVTP